MININKCQVYLKTVPSEVEAQGVPSSRAISQLLQQFSWFEKPIHHYSRAVATLEPKQRGYHKLQINLHKRFCQIQVRYNSLCLNTLLQT